MKLDPAPRLWQDLADGLPGHLAPLSEVELGEEVEQQPAAQPDEVDLTAEEDLGEETETAEEEEDGGTSGDEGAFEDIPEGHMYNNYRYVFECLTCTGQAKLAFLATSDAAALLSAMVLNDRLMPVCQTCAQQFSATQEEQQPAETPESPEEDPDKVEEPEQAAEEDGGQ